MNTLALARPNAPGAGYNNTLIHPTVRAMIHHLARQGVDFNSAALIRDLADLEHFPAITVGDLLSALRSAGVCVTGAHADIAELREIPFPFLTFLRLNGGIDSRVELVQVEKVARQRVTLSSDRFGDITVRRDDLADRWSGIVLMVQHNGEAAGRCELTAYRSEVCVLPDVLNVEECKEVIRHCEEVRFKRSRVQHRRNEVVSSVIQTQFRSSSSVVLYDRNHPLLARLYAMCAGLEGVGTHDIETIQCVRYKRGQRFRSHYDAGIQLPRLTTYLLYLNDDFTGGETYFPMLDHVVAPQAGACLRFPSCYPDGRIRWQSEHGGLPVDSGVKYALNIWVHCPQIQVSAGTTPVVTPV